MAEIREVDRVALKAGLADGSMILIDVREAHEYAAGHIPGAHSMPLSTFDPHQLPLNSGKRIVFSCRSGRRTLEALAVAHAAGVGVDTHYPGSMLDWLQSGEPVETGG
jgi:rhodanese-related sulfurtransferase